MHLKVYPEEWWIADCQVKNLDVNATLWQKMTGVDIEMIADGKNLIMENNVFNFTNLSSFAHDGSYYCEVCGQDKHVAGFKIYTDLDGKGFQYPKIINKPNSTVEFGADITLVCKVSGRYKLRWFKGSERRSCPEYKFKNTEDFEKGCNLTISKFSRHDEGAYSCSASRSIVNWSAQVEVRLVMIAFVKPAFVNSYDRVISFKEGETLNLSLVATGYPKPEVKCTQENERQNNIIANGSSAILYISKLMYSIHNGTSFQCTANNVNGSTTYNFSLNIWGKCVSS
ncbi:neogenin isoform X2 [Paramuricea clavata]|uniref:Neogenin isoform X2 n=1 Tax=Paramuricea clavata TaxID=317549 RepID=A0A7D9DR73_PARCT|nr:neogenin isoform X2 [Paramuricea clavata]